MALAAIPVHCLCCLLLSNLRDFLPSPVEATTSAIVIATSETSPACCFLKWCTWAKNTARPACGATRAHGEHSFFKPIKTKAQAPAQPTAAGTSSCASTLIFPCRAGFRWDTAKPIRLTFVGVRSKPSAFVAIVPKQEDRCPLQAPHWSKLPCLDHEEEQCRLVEAIDVVALLALPVEACLVEADGGQHTNREPDNTHNN